MRPLPLPDMTKSDIERFWSKVDVRGEKDCWLWTAGIGQGGYGNFSLGWWQVAAHRVSFELCNGPIPDGLLVCHSCDVPDCVNPAHLWVGTQQENIVDMIEKGRGRVLPPGHFRGEKHPRSKITEKQVRDIREEYEAGEFTLRELGRKYGVSGAAIHDIVQRRNWAHID